MEFTQVEDFNAIHIIYRHDGKVFDLNTNSLVADTSTTIIEPITKPTGEEKEEYRKEVILQDDDLNWFEKIIAIYHLKGWVIGIVLAAILILIVWLWFKNKIQKKQIKKAVKDLIEDGDTDGLKNYACKVFSRNKTDKDEGEE